MCRPSLPLITDWSRFAPEAYLGARWGELQQETSKKDEELFIRDRFFDLEQRRQVDIVLNVPAALVEFYLPR